MTTRSRTRESAGLTPFRLSIIAAVIGFAFIIGGAVIVSFEQQGQRLPLNIDPPPNAELRMEEEGNGTSRTMYYLIPNTTAEDVAAYYDQKLIEFYGNNSTGAERCRRIPTVDTVEGYVEGSGDAPYAFRCLFDSSGFGTDRFTEITVQPGVRNDATGMNYEGSAYLVYTQVWQP